MCDHTLRLTHPLASAKPPCNYSRMSRDFVNDFCASLPGSEYSEPWGPEHPCWKLQGKIYAVVDLAAETVSVKTPDIETAEILIGTGVAGVARYLNRSWVAVPIDSAPDVLIHRIRASYLIIRAALPRKQQKDLPQPRRGD